MMRTTDVGEMRQLGLFHGCTEETFDSLACAGFLQRFPRGIVLIEESQPADFLHIVTEGLVEMYATNAGRETTLGFVGPVGTFILAAVLKDQACLQAARTLESSRILMIPAESVRTAMSRDTGFMSAIVAELATACRQVVKELKNQKLRTGVDRLANWIIRENELQGGKGAFEIGMEKRVLASYLGMAPENLSRAFTTLSCHGVELNGPLVRMHQPAKLAAFARPNPLIDAPMA
jgi:CRP/FNR family transcriptional activator FtrB